MSETGTPTTVTDGPDASGSPAHGPVPEERSVARSVLVGVALAVGIGATVFFLIAIPFYTLASFEPNGIDRPVVRTGLFRIAMPVAVIVGLAGGASIGRWLHRGGRWTASDARDRYGTR